MSPTAQNYLVYIKSRFTWIAGQLDDDLHYMIWLGQAPDFTCNSWTTEWSSPLPDMTRSSPWFQGTKWIEPPKKVGHEWQENEEIINQEERRGEMGDTQNLEHSIILKFKCSETLENYPMVLQTTWSPPLLTPSFYQASKPNHSNSF